MSWSIAGYIALWLIGLAWGIQVIAIIGLIIGSYLRRSPIDESSDIKDEHKDDAIGPHPRGHAAGGALHRRLLDRDRLRRSPAIRLAEVLVFFITLILVVLTLPIAIWCGLGGLFNLISLVFTDDQLEDHIE